jgi:ketosteroid isomerase-like protein
MSQEKVELVRGRFEAIQRGDVSLLEQWTTHDLVIVQPPEVPDVKSYAGRSAVAAALETGRNSGRTFVSTWWKSST